MKKIEQLLIKQRQLVYDTALNESEIQNVLLGYHLKLIKCNFYKEFTFRGDKLDKLFPINEYQLPYKDMGEGDYNQIDFEIEDGELILEFFCSYDRDYNGIIFSVPLDIMESSDAVLNDIIIEEIIKKEEATEKVRKELELKNKKDRIATLEKELDKLKKEVK